MKKLLLLLALFGLIGGFIILSPKNSAAYPSPSLMPVPTASPTASPAPVNLVVAAYIAKTEFLRKLFEAGKATPRIEGTVSVTLRKVDGDPQWDNWEKVKAGTKVRLKAVDDGTYARFLYWDEDEPEIMPCPCFESTNPVCEFTLGPRSASCGAVFGEAPFV